LDWYPVSWNNLQLCTDLKACCCKSLLTFQIHSNWGWNKGLEGIKLGSKQKFLKQFWLHTSPPTEWNSNWIWKNETSWMHWHKSLPTTSPKPSSPGLPTAPKRVASFFQPNQALKKGFPNCGYMCPSSFLLCSALLSSSATYNKVSVLFFEVSNHQMPK
jgi:hypothetical protein